MSRSQPRTVVAAIASRLAGVASVAMMTCTVLAQTEPTVVPPPTPHASGVIGASVAGVTALGGMLSNCKAQPLQLSIRPFTERRDEAH